MKRSWRFHRLKKSILWFFMIQLGWSAITNEDRYFSPNLDGVKDNIQIPIHIKESSLVQWRLSILKRSGSKFKRIKVYQSLNIKEQNLTFEEFFSRIVEKDAPIKAPPFIVWDGTDQEGNQVEDDTYYFLIEAMDRSGNKSRGPFFPIMVDTVRPEIHYGLKDKIFSPNQDGTKETLDLEIEKINFDQLDRWWIDWFDPSGKLVRRMSDETGKSGESDQQIRWDGRDDQGELLESGFYRMEIRSEDLAGNRFKSEQEVVELVRAYEEVSLEASSDIFSPNGDSYYDDTTFLVDLSSTKGLVAWKIEIFNQLRERSAVISDDQFRKIVPFNGMGSQGKVLADGTYTVLGEYLFNSGNKPRSKPIKLVVDKQAPKIKLRLKNRIFNPQAKKGGDQKVVIEQMIQSSSDDLFQAMIVNESGEIVVQKNLAENPGKIFSWNGANDEGKVVQGKYVYRLVGEDRVGNFTNTTSDYFELITGEVKVDFFTDSSSLSSNGDGFFDQVKFRYRLNESYLSNIERGVLTIISPQKKIIRKFPFLNQIPDMVWDGKDQKGRLQKDGIYFYQANLRFKTKESVKTALGKIYLDTTPIDLKITSDQKIFSPNKDGHLDEIIFNNQYRKTGLRIELDRFILRLKNKTGVIYQQHEWVGKIPSRLIWRGLDQLKNPSPEGRYLYEIETIDHAYNRKVYRSDWVDLVRSIEDLTVSSSEKMISSQPTAKKKMTYLIPTLSRATGFQKIDYFLIDLQAEPIYLGERSDLENFSFSFDSIREELDQTDDQSVKKRLQKLLDLESGIYQVKTRAEFLSGNRPESSQEKVVVDNHAPEVQVNTRPDLFSPDGDGVNENLEVRITAKDNFKLKKLIGYVFRKVDSAPHQSMVKEFNHYYKTQLPFKIWSYSVSDQVEKNVFDHYFKWNGRGDLGDLVESATEYLIFVRVEDQVGLSTLTRHQFQVDILVERLQDGRLRVVLNNINFKYDSDEMLGRYQKVLQLLIKMFLQFPDYKLLVEGHTDSRGDSRYNQKLSLMRAKKVYQYLITHGISSKRLSYLGRGEDRLKIKDEIIRDTTILKSRLKQMIKDNYRKNRRVEFYLKKPTEKK